MANAQDIETIRNWIMEQPHLPEKIEDLIIERFILACGNIDKTKTVMDSFFKLRSEAPEFFTERDPRQEAIQKMFNLLDIVALPKRTEEGYQVYLHKLNDSDPSKFDFVAYGKAFFLMTDTRFKLESNIPNGDIPVFDMTGFSFGHLIRLMAGASAYRKYMKLTQDTHPVRLKQIHIINTNSLVNKLMTFIRPLLNAEVRDLIHFHSKMETFIEFISLDILPDEYGGTGGKMADIREHAFKKVEENRDWLMSNPWLSDESKRPAALKKSSTTSKITESFKTLCLD